MSAAAPAPAPAAHLLDIGAGTFAGAFGKRPFAFRHSVSPDHPLLTPEVVARRAEDWPVKWIEHHSADLPLILPEGDVERLSDPPAQVVRDLAVNSCWMVMWFLERVPAYRALLDECLDVVLPDVVAAEGAMGQRGANIFLSSPGGVVPVHFDRHHNLLLQVRGTKKLMIGTFPDPATAQRQIESHYGRNRNLDEMPPDVTVFEVGPGDGVYIPPYAFHWVTGGPEVSVAYSCGFRSPRSERHELVYGFNVRLRRFGLSPLAPGRSDRRDAVKAELIRWRRRLLRTDFGSKLLAPKASTTGRWRAARTGRA